MLRSARDAARTAGAATLALVAAIGCWTAGVAHATALPDGRAYELVSPPNKSGGDVMGSSGRTRAASDGDAVSYTSLAGFGDVQGTGVATEYMSVRDGTPGTNGWGTHGITPRQDPLPFGVTALSGDSLYVGDFSANLNRGVFSAFSPLTDAPDVANVENLYFRDDLRASGPGSYQLLTDGGTVLPPMQGYRPFYSGASTDFSHVVFESRADLTPGVTGSAVKAYESVDGVVRLLTSGSNVGCPGARPCSSSGPASQLFAPQARVISSDGSRVMFSSPTTNGGLPNSQSGDNATKVWMLDDHGTSDPGDDTTVQVNASEATVPDTAQPATYESMSSDGSRVFFATTESLVDGAVPGSLKLYMYSVTPDGQGHHLSVLNVDQTGSNASNELLGFINSSDDGHYVYFIADGQIVAGAPGVGRGIYEWHDGTISFVAAADDDALDTDTRGTFAVDASARARVAPDGTLLFNSATSLTGLDHGTCPSNGTFNNQCRELYVFSPATQHLACVSCNPTGPATADANDNTSIGTSGSNKTWHLSRALTDDGRRVFFETAEPLSPDDTNGKVDVYEYDVPSGTVQLISSGKDLSDSFFLDASANGDDVFFMTRERLVGWDTDGNYDVYDARVGGGFPDPVPVPPACMGDACRGGLTAAPSLSPPGSIGFAGPGNVRQAHAKKKPAKRKPVRCKRGFVRKTVKGKVRCVKRPVRHVARKAAHRGSARRSG